MGQGCCRVLQAAAGWSILMLNSDGWQGAAATAFVAVLVMSGTVQGLLSCYTATCLFCNTALP
jgi:hypothetical protein